MLDWSSCCQVLKTIVFAHGLCKIIPTPYTKFCGEDTMPYILVEEDRTIQMDCQKRTCFPRGEGRITIVADSHQASMGWQEAFPHLLWCSWESTGLCLWTRRWDWKDGTLGIWRTEDVRSRSQLYHNKEGMFGLCSSMSRVSSIHGWHKALYSHRSYGIGVAHESSRYCAGRE